MAYLIVVHTELANHADKYLALLTMANGSCSDFGGVTTLLDMVQFAAPEYDNNYGCGTAGAMEEL